ncbi:MAG: hypothetical protein M3531_16145, partial [Pseudomonadota bacterium]|nr:hypothetical protein [Pseudomonadota bacterium]
LAHATQQTDLDIGAFFNAEFVIRHGNTLPERSGVALSFCRRPVIRSFDIDIYRVVTFIAGIPPGMI